MSRLAGSGLRLTVHMPVGAGGTPPPRWVLDIQRSRGAAVWDGGLRPAFRRDDGTLIDPDPHDVFGYHLLLRTVGTDTAVAGVRVAPLEVLPDSRVLAWDPTAAVRLLGARGCEQQDVLEAGRLWVVPQWRRCGLGTDLLLAANALGRVLGRRLLWGTVGTRWGKPRMFLRAGFRIYAEFGSREVPELADTLRVAVADLDDTPASLRPAVVEFTHLLATGLDRPPVAPQRQAYQAYQAYQECDAAERADAAAASGGLPSWSPPELRSGRDRRSHR